MGVTSDSERTFRRVLLALCDAHKATWSMDECLLAATDMERLLCVSRE